MARKTNYGATSDDPEIVFGQSRTRTSIGRSEFNQLCETISSNLFTVQSSSSNLERALKSLGTRRDNQGLRDSIHVIQMSAKQIIGQISQELIQLASTAHKTKDRNEQVMHMLQMERLKSEFETSLQRYSSLQKEVASKMKSVSSFNAWEESSNTAENQNELEKVAQGRYQKLQELKQEEFDRQLLLEREQRIYQLESDIIDVNQIMKELSAMVHEQGETVNSIENNIDQAHNNAEEGTRLLEKAASYQRTHRKWLVFLTGLAVTVALVIALVLYLELRRS